MTLRRQVLLPSGNTENYVKGDRGQHLRGLPVDILYDYSFPVPTLQLNKTITGFSLSEASTLFVIVTKLS